MTTVETNFLLGEQLFRLEAELGAIPASGPDHMGAMVCVGLPGRPSASPEARLREIFECTGSVVVLNRIGDGDWLRLSAALYNELHDMDPLVDWLKRTAQ